MQMILNLIQCVIQRGLKFKELKNLVITYKLVWIKWQYEMKFKTIKLSESSCKF